MQFDIHTHTIASGHGTLCTITDMAKAAHAKGLSLLGITDHGPATCGAGTSSYFRSLGMAPHIRWGIRLLYGVELNILDPEGTIDLEDSILSQLDYAIASMHTQTFIPGTRMENTRAYLNAMKHPKVKLIGHCDDSKYPVDYQLLVQGAKEHQVLLELNEASLTPGGYRGDTRENNHQLLYWCRHYRHPIVLSSDSHGPERVGLFTYCEQFLEQENFPSELVLNHTASQLFRWLGVC